jgi:glycosyltransferase involved in cell wall biosynthesis
MNNVDVLMTVYNGEKFIAQTIESILAQSTENWRLIIVDDRSIDSTPTILREFARQESRLILLEGEHKGIAAAANLGLGLVEAPFLARIDADDIAAPQRLETQKTHLLENPDLVAVGSYVRLIDAENRRMGLRKAPTDPIVIEATLKTRNCMCHPSSMIRTNALRQIGGYRSKFHNSLDYDLWLRLSEIGRISNQALELLFYRRHLGQVSASANTHRQTLYSVGAAIDYFFRRHGKENRESSIDEKDSSDLSSCLQEIYSFDLDASDRKAINRHSMRLLRHSRSLPIGARKSLENAMLQNLSTAERLKHLVYSSLSGKQN